MYAPIIFKMEQQHLDVAGPVVVGGKTEQVSWFLSLCTSGNSPTSLPTDSLQPCHH
jgi:hypothetical protein